MKRYLTIFIIQILFIGCQTLNYSSKEEAFLNKATEVKILVYKKWSDRENADEYTFTGNDVKKILSFISRKSLGMAPKCGYTGEIDFLVNGKSLLEQNMFYNIDCNHVIFGIDNKTYCQYLTKEGLIFIGSLRK